MEIIGLLVGIIGVYAFIKVLSDKTIEEIRKQNKQN